MEEEPLLDVVGGEHGGSFGCAGGSFGCAGGFGLTRPSCWIADTN